ncbi:dihydroxyacetone kinase subunit DhaK [Paracoccus onubensis]|uniref:Dihydroxyacetone kinase subunit DhaK n=2 Tax=Paracoccus onubensis TaxID=1675788 RepID=A0A418T8N2_9RHOB|nr:dihydroxyacetone kinase subunit DhaK [Paracoccus onubensis]
MVAGMLAVHSDILMPAGQTGRVLVARHGARPNKVGIVIGGGSGHEPAFAGYVGQGLADAAALGNVFASPPPEPILEATRAADNGAGILYLYGNYAGDVMNFDMAAELARAEGIEIRSVPVADDVASAPAERANERRGIAGDFFVFKAAGAAADLGYDLDGVERVARKANEYVSTMGVALSSCSIPQTLRPNFELGHDEMEIGLGVHGEPGIRRGKVESADRITDVLMEHILGDLKLPEGQQVAVLVNGLGSTSPMELYIVFRRVKEILDRRGIGICRSFVGEYVTSMEMAGASVTVFRLDDELRTLLDHPCNGFALRVKETSADPGATRRLPDSVAAASAEPVADDAGIRRRDLGGPVSASRFRGMIRVVADRIDLNADWLSELDGVIGDGDHGVTMQYGWAAVRHMLDETPDDMPVDATSRLIAKTFLDAVGASSGPLYATAFTRAAEAVSGQDNLDAKAMLAFFEAAAEGIRARGKTEAGDKTMIDAWLPAIGNARAAVQEGKDVGNCLAAAAAGAEQGMKATANMEARRGRSSKLGKRSLGHIDPGAASSFIVFDGLYRGFVQGGGNEG